MHLLCKIQVFKDNYTDDNWLLKWISCLAFILLFLSTKTVLLMIKPTSYRFWLSEVSVPIYLLARSYWQNAIMVESLLVKGPSNH